ncbi:23S rRNA methyltransferase [Peptostreptococcus anaerobius]|uniref:23S rRNA methyltransferase n=2 Tax=Peptostreptococcus porci TaxID=2652282 RepID=A0A6N7WXH2_9FIRM|nr:23S rRNA methyltransferase [Peptostreptococcus porci]
MFPRTIKSTECANVSYGISSCHVETIVLLSKLDLKKYISLELPMDDMDLTSAESKATYKQIQNYVLEKYGFKVSNLYIAQVKEKYGIKERENYNKRKNNDSKQPICPIEKEEAIKDAFRYFQMI